VEQQMDMIKNEPLHAVLQLKLTNIKLKLTNIIKNDEKILKGARSAKSMKLSFRIEGEIKTFNDKYKRIHDH
jgi:hypothetical protein